MVKSKGLNYKRLVSILLLFFCGAFLLLAVLVLTLYTKSISVKLIQTSSGTIKVELIDKVALTDNTADKLSKKVKITTDNNKSIALTPLVKVTKQNVMFEFTSEDETFYFTAINKKIEQTDSINYIATYSTTTISSSSAFSSFRDNVNKGDNYAGSIVNLNVDVNLLSVDNWVPIGSTSGASFAGTFNGNSHKIENLKISEQVEKTVPIMQGYNIKEYRNLYRPLGLFGYVTGGEINNLWLNKVTITSNTEKPYPATSGVKNIGCLAGQVSGTVKIDNIKISNATVTVNNTNNITNSSASGGIYNQFRFEYPNGSSAGGLIGVVISKVLGSGDTRTNGTFVNISNVEINSTLSVTGTGGIGTSAGGVVGVVSIGLYVTGAGVTTLYKETSPDLTLTNCIVKSKFTVVENYNSVDSRYSCFGGIVGRFCSQTFLSTTTRGLGSVKVNNCLSVIDSSSSVRAVKSVAKSHPIYCYFDLGLAANTTQQNLDSAFAPYLSNNYYKNTGFGFTTTANAKLL